MKKRLLFIFYILSLYSAVWAQTTNVTITGTIFSSEDNMPLIGASVYVENEELEDQDIRESTLGVITNFDGEFSITIPQNIKNLYCSYIGHETFVLPLVKGKTDYTIQLTPTAQMLDAVVVTGYQTIERRKLTAAVSNVNISEETVGAIKSIDQALAGQIAGLQVTSLSGTPGAPMKIRIRGTSSLQGTQDPLWVLDGIPLEGTDIPEHLDNDITNIKQSSIAGLNPADIDNITVLKDAAATAIYGARAANGVIVITTKNGKIGKPKVSFSTRMTYTPTLSTKRLNLLNSEEKVNLELDLLRNKYNEDNKKGGVYHILDRLDLINAYQESGYEALTDEAKAQLLHLQSQSTDWGEILFRDALNQEYNVNISGGSEKVTYYNSLGFISVH
ncbi:MAG: TonB-dependent receptor plug domain-containing protein [Bacteroidales bacterium]|nr:TonB-dependent receptor plug domain-containing protein [Bacteroidales bacterium]